MIKRIRYTLYISDASELSSAQFRLDSARVGGFSAQLRSACKLFEPARLAKIGLICSKLEKLDSKLKNLNIAFSFENLKEIKIC